jgi:hypothetical protein
VPEATVNKDRYMALGEHDVDDGRSSFGEHTVVLPEPQALGMQARSKVDFRTSVDLAVAPHHPDDRSG